VNLPDHLQTVFERGRQLRLHGYRGRFAPTPSGPLHLGNLRTALISWLRARLQDGEWLLRIDDLDTPRIREGAIDAALADLRWLGLHWDGPVIMQSQRLGLYGSCLSALRREQLLYPCRCTRRQLVAGQRYPGTCRDMAMGWGLKDGRLPAWRLKVKALDEPRCGDLVLRRADGFIAYHLATALDELALGITEVVRGSDLAPVCIAQQAVIASLDQRSPSYRHTPLLCDPEGQKLSKREQAAGLAPLREQQWSPERVVGWLSGSLGLVDQDSSLTVSDLLQELRGRTSPLKACLD
tara:strand:+ start:38 stop:922 length:885 start_codon:yes stop_codon:yes gene_type:complete